MLKDVVDVEPRQGYRLHLCFEDGVEGDIDLTKTIPFQGVFAALRDPAFFQRVSVNRELGVVCWPNGADLDSDVLYAQLTGTLVSVKTLV